jgi:sugar O-acyltransferase (sialic acid O-acetyltransferase NeuD family)
VLISLLKKLDWHILGYTDDRDRGAILGAPHLGPDSALSGVHKAHPLCHALIGVGKVDASAQRHVLQEAVGALGFAAPVVVSPRAIVNEEVELGAGTAVFDGAVVNSGTVAGGLCILNTNSTVEHDCRLGDNVHIAPGATVSGGTMIGNDCMIGVAAAIVHGVKICSGCLIGAGTTVTGDIADPGVYAGNPARRIR